MEYPLNKVRYVNENIICHPCIPYHTRLFTARSGFDFDLIDWILLLLILKYGRCDL